MKNANFPLITLVPWNHKVLVVKTFLFNLHFEINSSIPTPFFHITCVLPFPQLHFYINGDAI